MRRRGRILEMKRVKAEKEFQKREGMDSGRYK